MEKQLNLSKCNANGKTRYDSPGSAKEAIIRIKAKQTAYNSTTGKRIKRRNGKSEQWRFYFCHHCKGYHLTSSPAKIPNATIVKAFKERVKTTKGLVLTPEEAADWKADSLPFPE